MARKINAPRAVDAAIDHHPGTANSSKKKRKRKDKETVDAPEGGLSVVDTTGPIADDGKRRKKKKKKKHAVEPEDRPVSGATASQEPPVVPGDTTTATTGPGKKEKKRKEKHKEEHRIETPSDAHIDPALTGIGAGFNANTQAFLSAVVSAAAGSVAQEHPSRSQFAHLPPSFQAPSFQNLPPGLGGPAISFSGEDLARALQSLDVAKLADALQALGEAGSITFPLPGQPAQSQATLASLHHPPQPVSAAAYGRSAVAQAVLVGSSDSGSHIPSPTPAIVSEPAQNRKRQAAPRKATPVSNPIDSREDHAHILAYKWISATKLNELSTSIGLQYKKGKFSASEEALLKNAIENYRMRNGLTDDQLSKLIFAKGQKDKGDAFWFDITSHLPSRPVVAVYHHVRRSFHPLKQQGKWMPAEDDALRQAVADLGQSWEKVSQRVGRMAGDCRDRWRNHVNNREGRTYGAWSKEEEDRLTQIVTEMTIAQGKDPDQEIFWTQVAARMSNRGRQQCRIKWTDCLSKTVKNAGQKPRWSQQDAYILVHKIASLDVNDDSEIDWKLLSDDDWNLWSAHTLQRRWLTLKRSVRSNEEMSHQEIMDILCSKKAQPPPMPTPVKRRVTSAPIVPAEAQASDVAIEDSFPLAGPSSFGGVPPAFPGDSGDAAQPPQSQFNHFAPGVPQVTAEQIVPADTSSSGAGNVQHSDNVSSSDSSSDSDVSDSE